MSGAHHIIVMSQEKHVIENQIPVAREVFIKLEPFLEYDQISYTYKQDVVTAITALANFKATVQIEGECQQLDDALLELRISLLMVIVCNQYKEHIDTELFYVLQPAIVKFFQCLPMIWVLQSVQ